MLMYKSVRKDKTSHYDKTTKWKKGAWIIEPNPVLYSQLCCRGIHSSPTLLHAVSYQQGPSLYAEVEVPEIFKGQKNIHAFDDTKTRATAVQVIRWLEKDEIDELSGFRLHEANNPVHPFMLRELKVSPQEIENLKLWASVGDSVRDSVRDSVGDSVRDSVRASVGDSVRDSVRDFVRDSVGDSVRDSVRDFVSDSVWYSVWYSVRDSVWYSVRDSVGDSVGDSVWYSVRDFVRAYTGSLFTNIKTWKYVETLGETPWEPIRQLWLRGFVPSFDGKTWRLHSGKNARVVYEWVK